MFRTRVLVLSPNWPSPTWGGGTRNYYLLQALASRHAVSLLALVDRAEPAACSTPLPEHFTGMVQTIGEPTGHLKRFRQLVHLIEGKSHLLAAHSVPEMQAALDDLVRREHFDAIFCESVLMAGYRLPPAIRLIIDEHNIEHELLWRSYQHETAWVRKWYNWRESRLLKPVELERCRLADAVLVTSEREHLLLKRLLPDSMIRVVPNGVDVAAFPWSCPRQEVPNRIIFTGAMNHYPNVDAVRFFAQGCWPLIRERIPNATWQIVGSNPLPEVRKLAALPGVTVTGAVPDVPPYLAAAAVAIVPLRIGSGTRLKILEAFAMQKAVVSTSLGCEGLAVVHGKHLLVEDAPEAFAHRVIGLLRDPARRTALGISGRSLVEEHYSWERCGTLLLQVLEEIGEKGGA